MKKQSGITLIALVVTIIVLLILAGVSIATLTGDNGILTRASNAKETQRGSEVNEVVLLTVSENQIASYSDNVKKDKEDVVNELFAEGKLTEEEKNKLLGENGETEVDKIIIGNIEVDFSKLNNNDNNNNAPGLYDSENVLLASWDELVNTYGLDLEKDYAYATYETATSAFPYILNNYAELSNGVKLILPDSITNIGDYAFYKCEQLTNVVINEGVTNIGDRAFMYCKSLENIKIPNTVITIGERAFYDCLNLINVDMGNNVTNICSYAFQSCQKLTSIIIPDSVTSLETGAFIYCYELESVTFGENIQLSYIETKVFEHCKKLNNVIIPDSVTKIGESAFSWCESLTSINIPESVTEIWASAFMSCSSLTSINIPENVELIGSNAFNRCFSMTNITVNENNEKFCSVDGVLYNKDKTTLIQCPAGNIDTTLIVPNSVTSIREWSLSYCANITNIVIPIKVTSIGKYGLCDCTSLATINYAGSQEQWNSITKGSYWDDEAGLNTDTGTYTVVYNYTVD